ncbi:MAG: NTP transferase domain-containing protein [Planctomycetaceae bacterium]|nr:NTP transferase domain-containing protein [Planctomycetaceae bacterium]
MRVVAIIQARTGSTRLPGKVLQDLAGSTMLARVIRRTARASLLDEVVVATTQSDQDDPVVAECRRLEAAWFRGNEHDVLDRYFAASEASRAELVVRVTSDCPLIDPALIDRVVAAFLKERPDYVSNFLERTYPRGLDNEAFPFEGLARAWCEAESPYQRVHVTPYFYENPALFRLLAVKHDRDLSGHRWTVDTPADMQFARAVYDRFGGDDQFAWTDVLQMLENEPELSEINRHVRQKELRDEKLAPDSGRFGHGRPSNLQPQH